MDNSYARLPEIMYAKQNPTPVQAPAIAVLNDSLAAELGLDPAALTEEENIAIFAGNAIPAGGFPLAQAYAGHQFGHFNILGDGRAVLLGEQLTPEGTRVDIQLKGSGPTPFSRRGDGRAALGPMLREYIISEAMYGLGIPTTRSLAVVTTGEAIYRETKLPGAILTRVAGSHLRVGTFQYAAQRGSREDLQALADYAINRHYQHLAKVGSRYIRLLNEVIARQAKLIAKWQLVGFVHGVMNTDNMTISGETIDYGPCAFIDAYDPATVFSSIDAHGRYAYGNQPHIAVWNLARLAEALLPLVHEDEAEAVRLAEEALAAFSIQYQDHWLAGMRAKLGLADEEEQDAALIMDLLKWMQENDADYTNTFRALTLGQLGNSTVLSGADFDAWKQRWQGRLERQSLSRGEVAALMKSSNPAIIPRNHLVEDALNAAVQEGNDGVMNSLVQALKHPYAYTSEQEHYATLPEPSSCGYQTFCGT